MSKFSTTSSSEKLSSDLRRDNRSVQQPCKRSLANNIFKSALLSGISIFAAACTFCDTVPGSQPAFRFTGWDDNGDQICKGSQRETPAGLPQQTSAPGASTPGNTTTPSGTPSLTETSPPLNIPTTSPPLLPIRPGVLAPLPQKNNLDAGRGMERPLIQPVLDFDTYEYRSNPPISASNVAQAHARGIDGRGVGVAQIDEDYYIGREDHAKNISFFNGDGGRISDSGSLRKFPHGDAVHLVMGASVNGRGQAGIAPGATYYSIAVSRKSDQFEEAFDNLVNHPEVFSPTVPIRVVNVSMGDLELIPTYSEYRNKHPSFLENLDRLATQNKVVVWAAGNEGRSEPAWPARFGGFQNARGKTIIAGAIENGAIWSLSNRAGASKNYFMVADGTHVLTDENNIRKTVSGTSLAAPMISAAAALVINAHPHLRATEVVRILLTSAKDMGIPGVDEIYGWGELDVVAALSPLGTPQVATTGGSGKWSLQHPAYQTMIRGAGPLPSALSRSGLLSRAIMLDQYMRAFPIDLRPKSENSTDQSLHSAVFINRFQGHTAFGFSWETSDALNNAFSSTGSMKNALIRQKINRKWRVSFAGGDDLSSISGGRRPFGHNNPYLGFQDFGAGFAVDHTLAANRLQVRIGVNVGFPDRTDASSDFTTSTYLNASFNIGEHLKVSPRAGLVTENGEALGSQFGSVLAPSIDARTYFAGITGSYNISPRLDWHWGGYLGRSDVSLAPGGLITHIDPLWTSSLDTGIRASGLLSPTDQLELSVFRSLSLRAGEMTLIVPTSQDKSGDPIFETGNLDLTRQGQWAIGASYQVSIENNQVLRIGGKASDLVGDPTISLAGTFSIRY